jgi:hypothetical protein
MGQQVVKDVFQLARRYAEDDGHPFNGAKSMDDRANVGRNIGDRDHATLFRAAQMRFDVPDQPTKLRDAGGDGLQPFRQGSRSFFIGTRQLKPVGTDDALIMGGYGNV